MDEFKERVMLKSEIVRALKIKKCGLAKVVGFPLALIAPELVMAQWECYHSNRNILKYHDGRILEYFSTK